METYPVLFNGRPVFRHDVPVSEVERELRAGRDYPIWPYLKWGHALRLHEKLRHDYQMWRASLASETRAEFSDDRHTVTFYAAIANEPPLYEWSLAFGDIMHNYRSALDALAWAMANLDDKRPHPRDERNIYFPITKSRAEFDKLAKSRLASVPDVVLSRMQSVQPYHGGAPELAIGVLLHNLDIQDKHHSAVEARVIAADKTSYSTLLKFEDDISPSAMDFEPEWVAPDRQIQDGDKIIVCRFGQPVHEAEITDLPLVLTVDQGGQRHDLFELLQMIEHQIGMTFRVIETGHLPESEE